MHVLKHHGLSEGKQLPEPRVEIVLFRCIKQQQMRAYKSRQPLPRPSRSHPAFNLRFGQYLSTGYKSEKLQHTLW